MDERLTSAQYTNIAALLRKGKRKNDELIVHRAIVDYLHRVLPGHAGFHCPNGERRDARTAAKLKSMGTRAGVPDLGLPLPSGRMLWLEIKAPGGKLSISQRGYIELLRGMGHTVAIVESIDDVRNTFKALGIETRGTK